MNKVQKKTNNAIAAVDESMFMADAQTQSGLENVSSADDLALPFLKVLSQLSPQCNKTSNNYVENAEPGMIYNTVSGTLFDGEQGIDVIAVNWRGLYTPKGASDASYKKWTEALRKVGASKEWKAAMKANGLAPFNKVGPDFQSYVGSVMAEVKAMSVELGVMK